MSNSLESAFGELESRFQAIVSNVPGLVFQFSTDEKGRIEFAYLSEACKALLGITSDELKREPSLFTEMMLSTDQAQFEEGLRACTKEFKVLNWEGQIWIEEWQDYKWINLRASPRRGEANQVHWDGIMTNITQSKREKQEIEESRRRLAELTAYMEQVKEQERIRIAREIHDDLGGNLTAIKIGLGSVIKKLSSGQNVSPERLKSLESIVDSTFEAAHRISSDLRPDVLELGIVAALEWQARKFEEQMSIPCAFTASQTEIRVTTDQAIALFRICQEAMSNIAKYAKANHIEVTIGMENDEIAMCVCDDGIGLKQGDELKKNSFGLRGMQERAAALKGSFSVGRNAPQGTRIEVKIPLTGLAS